MAGCGVFVESFRQIRKPGKGEDREGGSVRAVAEVSFWTAAGAAVSAFLYYCAFGKISFHGAAGFFTGLLLWKKMCCVIINAWVNAGEAENSKITARSSTWDGGQAEKDRKSGKAERQKEEAKKGQSAARQRTRGKMAIRRSRNRRRLMVGIIVVLIAGAVGFSVFNVISLKKEQHDMLEQQEELKAEKQELEKQLEEINDPKNIEEEARDQLRLIMPGETLYMFPEEMTENSGEDAAGRIRRIKI